MESLSTRVDKFTHGYQGLNGQVNNLEQGVVVTRDRAEGCWQSITRMLGSQADPVNQAKRQPERIRDEVQRQIKGVSEQIGNAGMGLTYVWNYLRLREHHENDLCDT